MEASQRRSHRARLVTAGMLAAGLLLLTAGVASAQIGEDLLPPLDETIDDTTDALDSAIDDLTDLLDDDLEDAVDDTTGELEDAMDDTSDLIGDTIDELTGGQDGSGDSGEPSPTGPGGTGGDGGEGGEGGGGGSSPQNGSTESSGTTGGSTGEAGTSSDGGASATDGDDHTSIGALSPSGSLAARAVIAAVTRAARLVWPLAPPLIMAGIALLGLAGMGRGSSRLLKMDPLGLPARRFRL